jgi:hypothetical protein
VNHGRFIVLTLVVVMVAAAVVIVGVEPLGLWSGSTTAPEAVGFRGEVDGTVRRVDSDTRVVTVARGLLDFSTVPIAITQDTRVNVQGKLGAFGDLREGVSLSVCYEVQPSGRWARSIDMPPSPAPCGAVADATLPEPAREEPARTVAIPDPPQPLASPPAAAVSASPQPPGTAQASPRPAAPERPAPPPPPVVTRPAPVAAPVAARATAPRSQASVAPAPVRPAETTAAAPARRSEPAPRPGEDFGAVIDWALKR